MKSKELVRDRFGSVCQPLLACPEDSDTGIYFSVSGKICFSVDALAATRIELLNKLVETKRMDPMVRVLVDAMLSYPEAQ